MNSNNTNSNSRLRLVIFLFIIQLTLDWGYVIWTKGQVGTFNSAWFALTPLFAYFYGFFSLFSVVGMYHKSRLALAVAYCVLLFGSISAVLSYNVAENIPYQNYSAVEFLIIPLLLMNACVVLYMASQQRFFMAD